MSEEINKSDDIFSKIELLPIKALRPFKDHPFKLYPGEELKKLSESIKDRGLLVPIIVRNFKADTDNFEPIRKHSPIHKYEILSGHNRVEASKLAGLDTIRAEIRNVDDDEAIKIVNETNIQQRSFEKWLESEKAQSINQYYESIKRQGKRSDLQSETSGESQQKSEDSESRIKAAEIYGVKENIIVKYLRLNKLISPLKDRLDMKKGDFGSMAATHIALLSEENQQIIESVLKDGNFKLTVEQAKTIKDLEKNGNEMNETKVVEILKRDNDIKTEPKSFTMKSTIVDKHFSGLKSDEIEAKIEKSIELTQTTIPQLIKEYLSDGQSNMEEFIKLLKKEFDNDDN